ncbi:MAG: hypothetical protein PF488_00025 [Patescibacteria group bacterium]|jgi:hypothetical protein|nr:hypothetical protein [Patescibacteria group bacterium]
MKKNNLKKGYITIITVITISAVSISVVLSLIFSSLGIISSGQSLKSLAQADAAANACVEEALERIRQDNNYQTSFSLSETDYSCQADISQISSSQFEIQSTGMSKDSYKKIRVTTSAIIPIITISSFGSVADF